MSLGSLSQSPQQAQAFQTLIVCLEYGALDELRTKKNENNSHIQ
jgi:hypothetical protein